jgi:hypothetical protein
VTGGKLQVLALAKGSLEALLHNLRVAHPVGVGRKKEVKRVLVG